MYICTFYSFKGGVGRSMALVNVAVDLAQRGRRVLAVDFDLEAPGLDTFPVLSPVQPTPGLVEFVARYLDTDVAPDVREFIGVSPAVDNLLVMPSGAAQTGYASNFGKIDWQALYAERDGYLLFEDLKEQWRQEIKADYVLIDSRTGYTDTGGICTRQLPDAVTVLFFPNEQNLRGLTKVIADIRSEANPPRNKQIELHFVMSNVPDLDDEDEILTGIKQRFQSGLEFEEEPLVVHRYDSLSLLNQTAFVRDRPKSRLAREYRDVGNRIVRGNLEDRDGAMHFIRRRQRDFDQPWRMPGESASSLDEMIKKIASLHAEDGEVLYRLGSLAAQRGLEKGESLLDEAIERGYREPEAYLHRARLRNDRGDSEGASEDAISSLQFPNLAPHVAMEAVRLIPDSAARDIRQFPAVASLDAEDQVWLAESLPRWTKFDASTAILEDLVDDETLEEKNKVRVRSNLAVNLMGGGEFQDAVDLLVRDGRNIEQMEIQVSFNYAMARWAVDGTVEKALFDRVVSLSQMEKKDTNDANFLQCLAVANWAVGDIETARTYAKKANIECEREHLIFSCWRYDHVSNREFRADMREIASLIDGDCELKPEFIRRDESPPAG